MTEGPDGAGPIATREGPEGEPAAEPRAVAIVGTGLIGTSIALAARRAGFDDVRGFDPDPDALGAAAARGGLRPATDLTSCVRGSAVAFVSVPVPETAATVAALLALDPDVVVSDTASAKLNVVGAVRAATVPAARARFVPGHPMTGSERSGPEAASAVLLDDTVWVLCDGDPPNEAAVATVASVVRALGARPVRMDAVRHDRAVALISHLPQVASTALMALAAGRGASDPDLLPLAAGGFRDLTRLAASNPDLWADILLANAAETSAAIDAYVGSLRDLAGLLAAGDRAAIRSTFSAAKDARLSLAAKPQARVGMAVLAMPIPDRPGALADVTSTMGALGVNIEDLEILHSAEGAKGALHLTISEESADAALQALRAHGYDAGRLA